MSSFASFSTAAVPSKEKPLLWGHAISRIYGDVDAKARLDRSFEGRVDYGNLGFLRLCKIATTATASVVSPRCASRDVVKLVIQQQGSGWYEQSGRHARLEPGSWLIYDSSLPFALTVPESSERYLLLLPKSMLSNRSIDMEAMLLRPFRADAGIDRLMCGLIRNAFEELCSHKLEEGLALAGIIMQLIEQVLTEHARAPHSPSRKETLRSRAKAFIRCRLRDSKLSVDQVAQAISCSKRNLHKVFEEEGSTVREFILRARLDGCRKALSAEEYARRTITEIALDHGFSSATHFSHAFKEVYGIAPREFRHSADKSSSVTFTHSAPFSLPAGDKVDSRR